LTAVAEAAMVDDTVDVVSVIAVYNPLICKPFRSIYPISPYPVDVFNNELAPNETIFVATVPLLLLSPIINIVLSELTVTSPEVFDIRLLADDILLNWMGPDSNVLFFTFKLDPIVKLPTLLVVPDRNILGPPTYRLPKLLVVLFTTKLDPIEEFPELLVVPEIDTLEAT
jgi:hypothetical protein